MTHGMQTRWQRGRRGAEILLLCASLGACGTAPRQPEPVTWIPSSAAVDADRYDYLRERQATVRSLVLSRLDARADPALRRALSCLRASPVRRVVAGEIQLDALRETIAAVLGASPDDARGCMPLAAEWRYVTLDARSPATQSRAGGTAAGEAAMAGGALWLLVCGNTLGLLCPVASGEHFRLSTELTLPDGSVRTLTGDANVARWRASFWAYRRARDEAFATALAEALLEIARAYAAVMATGSP